MENDAIKKWEKYWGTLYGERNVGGTEGGYEQE
jgi:hypothetical protein